MHFLCLILKAFVLQQRQENTVHLCDFVVAQPMTHDEFPLANKVGARLQPATQGSEYGPTFCLAILPTKIVRRQNEGLFSCKLCQIASRRFNAMQQWDCCRSLRPNRPWQCMSNLGRRPISTRKMQKTIMRFRKRHSNVFKRRCYLIF